MSSHYATHLPPVDKHLVNRGDAHISRDKYTSLRQVERVVAVHPRNATPATLLQTGQQEISFEIPNDAVHKISTTYLRMTVKNNAVGNLGLLDGYSLIESVRVFCNNQEGQTLYGMLMRIEGITERTNEELAALALGANLSAASPGLIGPVIAGGASYEMIIPIRDLLKDVDIYDSQFKWRTVFRFKAGTDVISSTSVAVATDITVSPESVLLYLDGEIYDDDVLQDMRRKNKERPHLIPYTTQNMTVINQGAVTSGSATQANIVQSGLYSALYFQITAANATNEALHIGQPITSFELLANGSPVSHGLSDNQYTYRLQRVLAENHFKNPKLFENNNVAVISFANDPMTAKDGKATGFRAVSGNNEVLRFVPGFTGNCNIYVYSETLCELWLDSSNGTFKFTRNSV